VGREEAMARSSETCRLPQTIDFAIVMQTMEEQATSEMIKRLGERMDERFNHVDAEFGRIDARFQVVEADIRELRAGQKATAKELRAELKETEGGLRAEIGELRVDIKSMQRTMLYGFFSLAGLMLTFAGFQLA
jgi:hypothetical protein